MSETADQARTRRRWISLAEFVAVAGLLIGAATLWLNWSERRDASAKEERAAVGAASARARLDLRAEVDGDAVVLSDPNHELDEVRVAFPPALGLAARTPARPRIEREWFADAVLKATDGGADVREGRLPVLVTASFRDGDATRSGTAIVDVVWRTEGQLLSGRALKVEAARVRERGGDAVRLDALWKRELAR